MVVGTGELRGERAAGVGLGEAAECFDLSYYTCSKTPAGAARAQAYVQGYIVASVESSIRNVIEYNIREVNIN